MNRGCRRHPVRAAAVINMASFILTATRTLVFENGYANVNGDAGGETYKGIARVFNPLWPGWKWIDAAKHEADFPRCLELDNALQDAVLGFYRDVYWRPLHGDAISNQEVASEIFDTAVLNGQRMAVEIAQGALKMLGHALDLDGIMGNETLGALNSFPNYPKLLKCMNGLQFMLIVLGSKNVDVVIKMIGSRGPQLYKFLLGWLDRV